jgi:hypothetical protein
VPAPSTPKATTAPSREPRRRRTSRTEDEGRRSRNAPRASALGPPFAIGSPCAQDERWQKP